LTHKQLAFITTATQRQYKMFLTSQGKHRYYYYIINSYWRSTPLLLAGKKQPLGIKIPTASASSCPCPVNYYLRFEI
jgi:hypothetical protein